MKEALASYVGKTVAINLNRSHKVMTATLLAVSGDGFRISVEGDPNVYWIPYRTIEHIAENPCGVTEGHLFARISTDAPVFIRLSAPSEVVVA